MNKLMKNLWIIGKLQAGVFDQVWANLHRTEDLEAQSCSALAYCDLYSTLPTIEEKEAAALCIKQ